MGCDRHLAWVGIGLTPVLLLLGLGLGLAQPVEAVAATSPTSHLDNGVCEVSGAPSVVPGKATLVLGPHPTGATIVWLPGLNSKTCAIATTHLAAAPATVLARAITRAPAVSTGGDFNCPADDGTRASISFAYAHGRSLPRLVVALAGCRFISQSDKKQKSMTTGVSRALASAAPCAWKSYVADDAGAC
jgi:hypothetical protein